MEYRCRLGTPGGEIVEGVYVAESESRLRRNLEEKGLCVLSLKARRKFSWLRFAGSRRGVTRQEFLVFNQELATLLKSGMPLVQSLDILRDRISNEALRTVLDGVYERVKAGTALSEAVGAHADVFPAVYAASLSAGERSGNLYDVIRRYVAYEKLIGTVRRRTISALIYPAILVALMFGLVGIIVLRVVPAFSGFYATFDRELPLSTRILVGASDTALAYFWPLVVGCLLVGIVLAVWLRHPEQRARRDRILLALPWAGPTVRKFATSQFARTLATLLGGGIALVNALEIAGSAIANRHLGGEMQDVARRVQEGESFSSALRSRDVFSGVAIKMVEVGESSGALREMLNSLADFYDEEIETELTRYITLIEPIVLVAMGVVIAAVVLALYMPLFELSSVIGV